MRVSPRVFDPVALFGVSMRDTGLAYGHSVATRIRRCAVTRKMLSVGVWVLLGATSVQPAWCDQWVTALTPTTVQTFNLNGAAGTYVTTTQTVVNPANCPATDGWVTVDPVISKEVLAMALSAVLAAHPIQIYVSSTQCANNRPMILDF